MSIRKQEKDEAREEGLRLDHKSFIPGLDFTLSTKGSYWRVLMMRLERDRR